MSESLIIKDGTGALSKLTVESGSYGLMPVHYVTSSNAYPVYITSSVNNPLPVTGNINVDVVVGDLINITSSHANPVAVTGTVSVNTISSNSNPVWITGSTAVTTSLNNPISVTGSVNIEGAVNVTSSAFNPLYVIGDINVTSSPAFPSYVTGDMLVTNLPLTQTVANDYYSPLTTWVTNVPEVYVTNSVAVYSSLMAPVYAYAIVTSSYLAPVIVSGAVNVVNNPLLPLSVSGSVSVANTAFNPLNVTGNVNITNIHLNSATGTIRSVFSTADSSIDFNDAVNYGAFAICLNNPIRKGLVIHNSSNEDLYLAISTEASTSYAGRNGFVVTASNAIPDSFSLILTAKQTHIADSSTVNLFYGGFFVSSSNYVRVMATETY